MTQGAAARKYMPEILDRVAMAALAQAFADLKGQAPAWNEAHADIAWHWLASAGGDWIEVLDLAPREKLTPILEEAELAIWMRRLNSRFSGYQDPLEKLCKFCNSLFLVKG